MDVLVVVIVVPGEVVVVVEVVIVLEVVVLTGIQSLSNPSTKPSQSLSIPSVQFDS